MAAKKSQNFSWVAFFTEKKYAGPKENILAALMLGAAFSWAIYLMNGSGSIANNAAGISGVVFTAAVVAFCVVWAMAGVAAKCCRANAAESSHTELTLDAVSG